VSARPRGPFERPITRIPKLIRLSLAGRVESEPGVRAWETGKWSAGTETSARARDPENGPFGSRSKGRRGRAVRGTGAEAFHSCGAEWKRLLCESENVSTLRRKARVGSVFRAPTVRSEVGPG
jgi:hypothetical protein